MRRESVGPDADTPEGRAARVDALDRELAATLDCLDQALLTFDGTLCLRRYSARAARLFGLSDDALGRPASGLDGLATFPGLVRRLETVLTVGGRYADELHSDRAVWLLQITRIDADDPQAGLVCALIETTPLRAAHRALIESEERYALAVEAAQDGLWEWLPAEDALFLSPRLCTLLGCSDAGRPASGAALRERIDPADRPRYDEALAAHLSGRTPAVQIELRMLRDDGTRLWVELHALARRDGAGRAMRVAGSIRDIADRRRTEAALRNSEEALSRTFAHAPIGMAVVDLEGRFQRVNRELALITGYEESELLGRNFRAITHPDDLERDLALVEALLTGERESYTLEKRYLRRDGRAVWVLLSVAIVRDTAGRPLHFTAQMVDISARKDIEQALAAAEQRWHYALEGSGLGVWDWNAETDRIFYSPRWKEMLGYADDEIGDTLDEWEQRLHPEDREAVHAALKLHYAGGTDYYEAEYRLRCRDGGWKWILDRGQVLERDADGRPLRAFGTHLDIDKRKHAEAALAEALRAASAAAAAKSVFLTNMSHEIRTPLNAVLGLARLAERRAVDPLQRDWLTRLRGAGATLLALVDDILDASRIEAGGLSLERTHFTLDTVLSAVADQHTGAARAQGLEFTIDAAPGTPARWLGDPLRVQQILGNLVDNAVKFTAQGRVGVEVSVRTREGCAQLCLAVEDTGIGIDPARIEKLFDAYAQGDSSMTRRYGGSGLGLTIARRLAEAMGGTIEVDSSPGRGSRFTACLALEADEPAPAMPLLAGRTLCIQGPPGPVGAQLRRLAAEHGARLVSDPVAADWLLLEAAAVAAQAPPAGSRTRCAALVWRAAASPETAEPAWPTHLVDAVVHLPCTPWSLARELAEAPDRPQPAPAAPAGHAAAPAADPDLPPPLGGLRVLLAEDNPVNQMVVRGLLPGLPLDLAANGREALDLLQRAGPDGYDLVLMDVQMPELDGLEATRRLRTDARFAALPVVALTAHALPEEIDRCRAAGMDEHLAKPIDPPALYGTLRRLAMPRAERRQAAADAAAAPAPAAAQVPTGGNGGGSGGGGDWPSLPGIDRERARQHTGGKLDLYETLLAQFARDHLDADRRVRRLLAGSERLAAVRLAHTLKGSAGTLGAVRLQFRAAALESVLCRPDKPADEALADFAEAFAELRAGIEQWQAERQPVLDAVGPGAPRRDPAELAQQLALLIGDHDTSALAVAEQLVAACAGASLEAQVREMTQAVRNYDFTRAAALLRGSGLPGSRS